MVGRERDATSLSRWVSSTRKHRERHLKTTMTKRALVSQSWQRCTNSLLSLPFPWIWHSLWCEWKAVPKMTTELDCTWSPRCFTLSSPLCCSPNPGIVPPIPTQLLRPHSILPYFWIYFWSNGLLDCVWWKENYKTQWFWWMGRDPA